MSEIGKEGEIIPSDIILPPDEVKQMIIKTAGYVNRNGKSFELRLKDKNSNDNDNGVNSKFSFLFESDPYFGYYNYILSQLKTGKSVSSVTSVENVGNSSVSTSTEINGNRGVGEGVNEIKKPVEFEHYMKLPSILQIDLEVIKLTAKFIAINGEDGKYDENFMNLLIDNISNKLSDYSGQFEFLKKTHSFYKIFKFYKNSYNKLINFKNGLIDLLNIEFEENQLLDELYSRAEYEKKIEIEYKNEKLKNEKEKLEFASINWDEFSIVETIEFTEIDDVAELPGPLNKSELEYRSLIQKQSTSLLEEAPPDFSESEPIEEVDHKEKEEEEEEQEYATNDQDLEDDDEVPGYDQGKINKPIQRSVLKGMNIKAAGVSRLQQQQQHQNKATSSSGIVQYDSNGEKLLRCPISNQLIPESKFAQHIQILLRDPRYKDEKRKYELKYKYSNDYSGDQIYENIKNLVNDDKQNEDVNVSSNGNFNKRQQIWDGNKRSVKYIQRQAKNSIDPVEEQRKRKERYDRENKIGPQRP
ncbi:hypothetical protein B5S28_g4128 [[Candida] boidinii]|nr:hypothetical protein B5S28_g4128 [[Candida] boidinii]OWB60971.1 hypothetical protein B5S29_g1854 [[Candida] boidinii]OWB72270.1 hypothetical protein B5S31_g1977 [[Candida] boidinii]OWB80426.1 hypothetical protein B5S32_g4702 [[Candida] boidinii]